MRCFFARRAISRAEDRGTKPPQWAERHAGRCGACGEFTRFTVSLKARLAGERAAFLAATPEFPLNEAAWAEAGDGDGRAPGRDLGRRLVLRPLPAAAGALVVLAAGLVLFLVVRREAPPTAQDRAAAAAAIRTLTAVPEGLQGALGDAESSLEKERKILERSLSSAAEYLQARLNIKIERREPPKEL